MYRPPTLITTSVLTPPPCQTLFRLLLPRRSFLICPLSPKYVTLWRPGNMIRSTVCYFLPWPILSLLKFSLNLYLFWEKPKEIVTTRTMILFFIYLSINLQPWCTVQQLIQRKINFSFFCKIFGGSSLSLYLFILILFLKGSFLHNGCSPVLCLQSCYYSVVYDIRYYLLMY